MIDIEKSKLAFNDLLAFMHDGKQLENVDDTLIKIEHGINLCEATEQKYEALVRDVKRYFELDNKHGCTLRDIDEWLDLERKLMKVGKKDV